jgi:dipeptidyl aminopeptidase/acylaminoacyl peptidase
MTAAHFPGVAMSSRSKICLFISLALATVPIAGEAQGDQSALTLEQIMADPDWLGNAPKNAFWGVDSSTVYFEQKRQGSKLSDLFAVDSQSGSTSEVPESEWSGRFHSSVAYNQAGDQRGYVYEGDIYLANSSGSNQVTRSSVAESDPMFMTDGRRIAFLRDDQMFVHDPADGLTEQVTDIRFSDDPNKDEDFDVLRSHQLRLYSELQRARQDKEEARNRSDSLFEVDDGLPAAPVYMGDDLESQGQTMSPSGRWTLVVTQPKSFDAGADGSMPNFVTEDGYVENITTRTRVGRNGYANQAAWLVDLNNGDKFELDLSDLPGMSDDPLEALRESAIEIFVAQGEDREAAEKRVEAPETRGVQIWMPQWSSDGTQLSLYIRSNDNKDRWITSVNLDDKEVTSQHRESDEAWVNPYHIQHGWLKDNRTIWFLSEDHGYLGIYTKDLDKKLSYALVAGNHVVFNPQPGPSGRFIYYQANVQTPVIYEIWRVDVNSGKAEQMTTMGGVNSVSISPDESRLLITHSEINRHPELFVMNNEPGAEAIRLTDTMSEAFKSIPWMEPDIVAIPSSHSDDGIYTKIYLPENHDPAREYPAVMFVHGAGYTQNSDMGWPYYFREGMFHNMLTQHGYVVIDMDYRASQGYGRDWRTAIYRRMGHPELEDFRDGVDYMVENYGVGRDRIGIYGGSYGGFMACIAMFRAPGLFKAGAGLRSVTDWSHYNHGYTANILNTPDIDPEAYRLSSPIEFADGLQDPLLIAVGMQDDNVFFQDSVLLVQRLIELEKEDFEIAIYPMDPHSFIHAASWLDEYRRIFKLFEANLK